MPCGLDEASLICCGSCLLSSPPMEQPTWNAQAELSCTNCCRISRPEQSSTFAFCTFVHFSSLFFRQLSSMEACFLFSVTTLGPKGFFHPSVILKDQGAEATFLQVPLCNVLQVHHWCPVMRETMHMPKRCSVPGKLRTKPETSRSGSFHSGRGFASDN